MPGPTLVRTLILSIAAAACALDDPSAEDSGDAASSSADGSASADSGPTRGELAPTDPAELLPWLQRGEYLEWTAESGIHLSEGPHGGDVLTFVNTALLESLDSGATEHPIDAATVKELYDDDDVVGWAVMVKVATGTGGATWFWYERVGSSVYAAETDVELCYGCHEDGTDQILTPYPLQ
jgi:hypothetical protein